MRNIIQNGLFVIRKKIFSEHFLFPFLRPKLIHAGCFIILEFFLKIQLAVASLKATGTGTNNGEREICSQ
jgi:hypothetical protein